MTKRKGSNPIYQALNPTQMQNAGFEQMYLRLFGELSMNRFTWHDMPEEIDVRFIELALYMRGLAVFYKETDKYNKFLCLRAAGAGGLDMYNNPLKFIVYGNQMISDTLDADECVPIWSNALRIPEFDVITTYSGRLAQLDRTIDNNVLLLRKGLIFTGVTPNQRITALNMWRNTQEGEPVMIGNDALSDLVDGIKSIPNVVQPRLVHDLQIAKSRMWNEAMTFLGINNSNQDKKERLVADEVSANDAQVESFRNAAMNARERAAEAINRKYGLNVSVTWNASVGDTLTDAPTLGQSDVQDAERFRSGQ